MTWLIFLAFLEATVLIGVTLPQANYRSQIHRLHCYHGKDY